MANPVVPPGIEHFPPWAQALMTLLGFAFAAFLYFRSIMKPGAEPPAKSKDVVVPGVNVLDGQIFAQATEQLKQSMRSQEQRDAQVRELQRELAQQSEIMRDCLGALRACCEHLDSIDRRLRLELKRQADEAGRL